MPNGFVNLLRNPDDIKIQADGSPLRFEERGVLNTVDAQITCRVSGNALQIFLIPGKDPVKQIRLRFRGDCSGVRSVLGDFITDLGEDTYYWHAVIPHETFSWYFYAQTQDCMHGYGVKTGCNSFARWQIDPAGITLWLDVRNGRSGVLLKEPLLCAEVVQRCGEPGEDYFHAAQQLCEMMCEHPVLPERQVFGFNNWYWAYGNTNQAEFIREARYLGRLCEGLPLRPYVVMDDGWQIAHTVGYNGGPWITGNERFPSLPGMAEETEKAGCIPGIWIRPLLTLGHIPGEAVYKSAVPDKFPVLDPSHPFTQERVTEDIRRLVDWGYRLIKFDFILTDIFGTKQMEKLPAHMYDPTLTNAQIMLRLYRTIQDAAGTLPTIACDSFNHLTAGINPIRRSGNDTSGRSFEITTRNGPHCLMRLPQNRRFFMTDIDCAAFTEQVNPEQNLKFMELTAITGCPLFASVTPGILTSGQEEEVRRLLALAAAHPAEDDAVPLDWAYAYTPHEYLYRGKKLRYDGWYSEYDGSRQILTFVK